MLFGGSNSSGLVNRSSIYWEGNDTWKSFSTASGPTARSDFAFAGTGLTELALLFGGLVNASSSRVAADTWSLNFSTWAWTNHTTTTAPPARQDPAFAVAPNLGMALLYGGWNRNFSGTGALTYGDTWILNLTTFAWSRPAISGVHPPPLEGASLTWDPTHAAFDLFGGCFPCVSEIWLYSPATGVWSVPSVGGAVPSPRGSPVWAYDPAQHRDVLFGGIGNGGPLSDTYDWDPLTGNWTPESAVTAPAARYAAAAAWMDAAGNETLLLTGGAGFAAPPDLWRLAPVGNLSVLVRNGTDLRPVANATTALDGGSPVGTNAHGFYNVTPVSAAVHTVSAIAPGFAQTNLTFWISPGLSDDLVLTLPPVAPANLTVSVIDLDGVPIVGATVAVYLEGNLVRSPPLLTGPSGLVNYTGIPTFSVKVSVSAPYFHPASRSVALVSGATTYVQLQLNPFATAWVHVIGYLLPLGFSLPLFGANVSAGPNLMGLTDLRGGVFLQMGVSGVVLFVASAPGFAPSRVLAFAPSTGLFLVNLTLVALPFGTAAVLVLDSQTHQPVPEASVNLTAVVGSPIEGLGLAAVSGVNGFANGTFPPANYSTTVEHPGYFPNDSLTPLRIDSGAVRRFVVNLTPLPANPTRGGNGTAHLLPPGHPPAWPFLVVPAVLLLGGGAYLVLLRGERSVPAGLRPRTIRLGRPPPPPDARVPPPPPPES